MSRSGTPLATTRQKAARGSRNDAKLKVPGDEERPRREGIFVLGEQDQGVIFEAARRQDWDAIRRIYEALETERELGDLRTEFQMTLATRLCGKSPAELAETEADKRAARKRKKRRSRQAVSEDSIDESTVSLPIIERKLRNGDTRATKGMRTTVSELMRQNRELELKLHRSGLLHSRLLGGGILRLVRVVQLRVRGLCSSEALWWCCRRRLLRGLKL